MINFSKVDGIKYCPSMQETLLEGNTQYIDAESQNHDTCLKNTTNDTSRDQMLLCTKQAKEAY